MTNPSQAGSSPGLVPPHGGYRQLKSCQMAEIVHDATVKFCDGFIDPRSRTHDQMVQAARSGKQSIAEGSQASGTSRKMELKLVGVARASLEELLVDYQDFLRQRSLSLWPKDHPTARVVRGLAVEPDRTYDGVTYLDIYFVQAAKAARESLHFHELVHVVQWQHLGPDRFLIGGGSPPPRHRCSRPLRPRHQRWIVILTPLHCTGIVAP